MVLEQILTEAEIKALPEAVAQKIESDYQARLEAGVKAESKKTADKFEKLLESVNNKVEDKINSAVESCIGSMRTDAINTKMYAALQGVAAILESSGIEGFGDTQLVKKLKQQIAQNDIKMKEDYKAGEQLRQRLGKAQAEVKLLNMCQGLDPNTVNQVMKHFGGHDEREITKEAVTDFIQNHFIDDKNGFVIDVDPDPDSVTMDKIRDKVKDIDEEDENEFHLDFDGNSTPTTTTSRNFVESVGHGLSAQKIGLPGSTVTLESIRQEASETTDDVATAMRQMAALNELGIGGRFG